MVASTLRRYILEGTIPDGAEFTQEWVALQLGVSRMPIREALNTLEFEGYIEKLMNRRLRVSGTSDEMLSSRLRMYSLIELDASKLIAGNGYQNQASIELSEALKIKDKIQAERQFHSTLYRLTENAFYYQMYNINIRQTLDMIIEMHSKNSDHRLDLLSKVPQSLLDQQETGIEQNLSAYFASFKQR